jgi:protein SCO1
LVTAVRAGVAIAALALFGCHSAASGPTTFTGTVLGESPAPEIKLTDQDGRPFTLSSRKGHEVVLFFGYTHCPDECPLTMSHLAQIVHQMPAAQRDRVQVVFVTVDPKRDNPATLRKYLRAFDPSFVGLTGTQKDVDATVKAYHVWVARLPKDKQGGYREAHESAVYLIDPEGRLRLLHGWQDPPANLATDMQRLLGA